MICHIVAMDKNNGIGFKNSLPWDFPEDMKHFKEMTTGHTVYMGRKTFESIGRPLPNRRNIVLTSGKIEAIETISDINDIKQGFVIGGTTLYEQTLHMATRLYITHINACFEVDAYYPQIPKHFKKVASRKNELLEFAIYEAQEV